MEKYDVFISYRHQEPDRSLAHTIAEALRQAGYQVFTDTDIRWGMNWVKAIKEALEKSDYFFVLLSPEFAASEMAAVEIEIARELAYQQGGHPVILPVRVCYPLTELLPYPISAYLSSIQQACWDSSDDTARLVQNLQNTLANRVGWLADAPKPSPSKRVKHIGPPFHLDPRDFIIPIPGGMVKRDSFAYIVRDADWEVLHAVRQPRALVTLRGSRQTGKTSLMMSLYTALHHEESGLRTVFIDLQAFSYKDFQSLSTIWRAIAIHIADQLQFDDWDVTSWQLERSYDRQFTRFLDDVVFHENETPLLICLDEVDRIFDSPIRSEFFPPIRAFYNRGELDLSWRKVRWLLGTSSEPSFFIADLSQSPFNIGLRVELNPFTRREVMELSDRFGLALDDEMLERIMHYIGGHPYLVHLLLYKITRNPISFDSLFDVQTAGDGVFRDHLHRYLMQFLQDKALAAAMANISSGHGCTDLRMIDRLEAAGLVRRDETHTVVPSCSLYADFFRHELMPHVVPIPEMKTAQAFLKSAGATIYPRDLQTFTFKDGPVTLQSLEPIMVRVASDTLSNQDIASLIGIAIHESADQPSQAGILIYRTPPDALVRLEIARARLKERFVVIPMPLSAVEQSLREDSCRAVLSEYADRYLPGADLFDDRNAIADTFAFFVRSELLHRLSRELIEPKGIGLFGLRKSGKTSILLQLALILREHPVVHVDLQLYSGQSDYSGQILNAILKQLSKFIDDPMTDVESVPHNVSDSMGGTTFAQRFIDIAQALQQAGYRLPVICALDEMEHILPTRMDSRDKVEAFNAVFGTLRALSQDQRILSLLVADAHPDCSRINQWEQKGVPTNPVFSFFKEIFVSPFPKSETETMLIDIGRLMGQTFDQKTLEVIHQASGGHPFVSRQLASFLCQKVGRESDGDIDWPKAKRYLERPFRFSGILKAYVEQNIWKDLEKRDFQSAIAILKILAGTETPGSWVIERDLNERLCTEHPEGDILDAVLWLEDVGLIDRKESEESERYRMRMALLARWLRMQTTDGDGRQRSL